MAEHSKTPWELRGAATLRGADGDYVATIENNGRRAANAAFIVSAVNCHAELVALAEQFEQTIKYYAAKDKRSGGDEGARMKLETMHSVRETIAKARGETP